MPAHISLEDVRRIARLARLSIDDEEALVMQAELSAMLDHFAELGRVDAEGALPHGHARMTELREDSPAQSLPREDVLRQAPCSQDGSFAVPAVMEREP